jgi:hypothetical protein
MHSPSIVAGQAAESDTVVKTEICMGCKGEFPAIHGPTHRYMKSSPGCWAAFGRVLAREYSDQQFLEVHRLTVDSYAVQHPGQASHQSIQSVGVHLVRLCLFLEHQLTAERANSAMLIAARHKSRFCWLDPPASLGEITVASVDSAASADDHKAVVKAWAAQMWNVWAPYHEIVRGWASAA